ncbi:peptide-methionine (S)-S-oxide reductase MsrA [Uliginosibacterium sp. H3]|uniref:Peptide methionine sulfoxide reductase MsrA n=1 Tax=Uliginosibacterium silvisoli TaxID=3114758 RepID=A0ABU6K8G1_9RHOO|nr:peptide-methionine (S)-S-oxide reductase MsrA [Uliginosibacterium sp. H3]
MRLHSPLRAFSQRLLAVRQKALPVALVSFIGASMCGYVGAKEQAVALPDPVLNIPAKGMQTAVFAGGCFWGVQAVFQHSKGVMSAISGYSGGPADKANYPMVSGGGTGHAESVKVTYDATKISYAQLLKIFMSVVHNPTELNRQGPDTGTQYRSAIFYTNEDQQKVTQAYFEQLKAAKSFSKPIVTQVVPLKAFYDAEAYHQDYATLHPDQPYIAYNDLPKVANLKSMFPAIYRDSIKP